MPVIAQYEKVIRTVFDFYRKMTMVIGDENIQNTIMFVDLNKFNAFFNIHPGLVSPDQTNLIYRQLTMGRAETTIDYSSFCKYLVRVAAAAFKKLRDISARCEDQAESPRIEDVEALFEWLGFKVSPAEMTTRLND